MRKLKNITLKTLDGEEVSSSEIIKRPTVIFIVRRPGCLLSRSQAFKLNFFRKHLNTMGIDMIAITKELTGVDRFKMNYWSSKIYIDPKLDFYTFIGGGKLKKLSLFHLATPSVLKACCTAYEDGYKATIEGESLILGGLLVVNEEGEVKYEYPESYFGDQAPLTEVLGVCKIISNSGIDVHFVVSDAVNKGLLKYNDTSKTINIDYIPVPCIMVDRNGKVLYKNKETKNHQVARKIKDNIFLYCDIILEGKGPVRNFFKIKDKIITEVIYKVHYENSIMIVFVSTSENKKNERKMLMELEKQLKSPINKLIKLAKTKEEKEIINDCIMELIKITNDIVDYNMLNFDDFVINNKMFAIRETLVMVGNLYDLEINFSDSVPVNVYSNEGYIKQVLVTVNSIVNTKQVKIHMVNNSLYFELIPSATLEEKIVKCIKGDITIEYDGFPGTCVSIHVCKRLSKSMGGDFNVVQGNILFYVKLEDFKIDYNDLIGKNVIVYLKDKEEAMAMSFELIKSKVLPLVVFNKKDADYTASNNTVSLVITDDTSYSTSLPKVKWNSRILL